MTAVRVLVVVLAGAHTFLGAGFALARDADQLEAKKDATRAPRKDMEQIARLAVANELMRLHWTSWVSGKELKEIARETANGINTQLESAWQAEFLLPAVKAKPQKLDDFEKKAVEDIRAGLAELWQENSDGVRYARGIRATKNCIQCHHPLGAPRGKLMEGDLLGIISIKFGR